MTARAWEVAGCVALVLALAVPLGRAHAQVDPSGRWRTWTTAHFRIHAREDLAVPARRLAREAERAYRLLAVELRPPGGRIDVALFDNVDFSNGFANVFPSDRVTIYLAAPGTEISLGVYDDWLRLVTTHELAHVFHLSRADGVWRVLRGVFGRNPALFPNSYQPAWITEGLATYYESRFTTSGRERGGLHRQALVGPAGGPWPGPNDITFASPVWPAGLGPYAWGSRFFQTVADAYGDSVIPGFVDRSSRQWWPIALSAPLRGAGGPGMGEAWAALRDGARAPATGGFDAVLARGLRGPPRLRMAPDGRHVAYVDRDGRSVARVVVRDLATGARTRQHAVTGGVDLAWRGDTVYVTQLQFVSPVEIRSDLYRWAPDGAWQRRTHGGRYETPTAFPNALVVVATTATSSRLVRFSSDASEVVPVRAPPGDDWGRADVSADGRWIVAARHAAGRWDIVAWPADQPDDLTFVTDDAARDEDPVWSRDGRRVLYVSERHGIPQVFGYERATGTTTRLTSAPTGAREPAVAADGALIYSTLLADGYAVVSQRRIDTATALPSLSAPRPLAPAPDVPIAEGGYDPWPALVPRYWIPTVHDEATAGWFVGARTGSNDPAGRFSYGAVAAVAPAAGRWEAVVGVRFSRWPRAALDAQVGQTWAFGGRALTTAGDTVPLAVRERFVTGGITWRWRRWRSSAALRIGGELERDLVAVDGPGGSAFVPVSTSFGGGIVSFSAAVVRRPPMSISPEDGVSVSLVYRRRWVLDGAGWSDEWRPSASGYLALPLPGFAHWVLAARVRLGLTGGPRAAAFAVGGTSSETFEVIPGVDIGGTRRSFPLRGYPAGGAGFTRVATEVLELRIPVLVVARGFWNLPIGIDRVSVSLFGEAGGGWMSGDDVTLTAFRDVGAELVLDLVTGYDTPVRVRAGAAVPLAAGLGADRGDVRAYLSIGAAF